MKRLMLAMATLALVASPIAGVAHSPNQNATCAGLGDEAETTVGAPAELGVVYVDTEADHSNSGSTPGVWLESNGTAGLQTHSHVCTDKTTDEVKTIEADTRLV